MPAQALCCDASQAVDEEPCSTEAFASPSVTAASGYGAVGAVAVAVTQPHLLQPRLLQQIPQPLQQVQLQQVQPPQALPALPALPSQLQSFPNPITNPAPLPGPGRAGQTSFFFASHRF